jgi:gas vesicle protein
MSERIYYSQEAAMRAQQQRAVLAGVVMLVGLGVGTALALLFAPKSGEEIRKDVSGSAERAIEGLQREVDRLRRDIEDRIKHG